MRERPTARVLLLDADNRILLMKGRLPGAPAAQAVWFTLGGGMEPGETPGQTAAREVREETGFDDVTIGEVLFRAEWIHHRSGGEPLLFKETFLLGRCGGGEPSRAGWLAHEQSLVDDMRWWTLAALAACDEPVAPPDLVARLSELLATTSSEIIHDPTPRS